MVSKIKRIKKDVTKFVFDITPLVIFDTKASEEHEVEMASFRNVGTGGTGDTCPPKFFKETKVPFFVMKSALFVQTNVAVNTILTRRCPPFCLEIRCF
jgi:hypothetical protein